MLLLKPCDNPLECLEDLKRELKVEDGLSRGLSLRSVPFEDLKRELKEWFREATAVAVSGGFLKISKEN